MPSGKLSLLLVKRPFWSSHHFPSVVTSWLIERFLSEEFSNSQPQLSSTNLYHGMFSLFGVCTFQVFVAFIILPLSYCTVRFLDLTPFIFSHQSITSNPPVPLIISCELSPGLWVLRNPRRNAGFRVWSRHNHRGLAGRGESPRIFACILNSFWFPFQK